MSSGKTDLKMAWSGWWVRTVASPLSGRVGRLL